MYACKNFNITDLVKKVFQILDSSRWEQNMQINLYEIDHIYWNHVHTGPMYNVTDSLGLYVGGKATTSSFL